MSKKSETVKVAVRCRPMNDIDRKKNGKNIVIADNENAEIFVKKPTNRGSKPKQYTFDFAYGEDSTQKQIYDECASQIVLSVLEGYNGTIFAYGQTGTGKTWTMDGNRKSSVDKGIIPRAFEHVFKTIEGTTNKQFLVTCSMLEIYNEKIKDLLKKGDQKLEIKLNKDKNRYVKGLSENEVKSERECMKLADIGAQHKSIGETEMNKGSSRSHCIFSLIIETSQFDPESGETKIKRGKLNLVDLAGSERQKKTKATGSRLKEAMSINLSLTTLGKVISALVDSRMSHIPYRDSKLTMLLEDSLGGNAKTVMIAAIGPSDFNYDETINTLRYANRAKNIKNKPKINQNPKDAKIREMQDEIFILKKQLQNMLMQGNSGIDVSNIEQKGEGGGANYNSIEEHLKDEAEKLDKEMEEERKRIITLNVDTKKREELMRKHKKHMMMEEQTRKQKNELLKQLKNKNDRILIGKKQNEKDLKKYNAELETIRLEMKAKKEKQKQLQEEILNAQAITTQLKGKLANQKEYVTLKANSLAKISRNVEKQRDIYEEMVEENNEQIKDLKSEVDNLSQVVKLNQLVLQFVPRKYLTYLIENLDRKIKKVPHKNLTGNKQIETIFEKQYKLINSWREGNEAEIVYHNDPKIDEQFFKINPTNEYSSVKLVGKEVQDS